MSSISEAEFARLVDGIVADRVSILRHNPIGNGSETLLWMLMSCLVSYLSLTDQETPCFTGRPDAQTYLTAVHFILEKRRQPEFDPGPYLARLSDE